MSQVEHLQPVVLIHPEGPALWRLAEGTLALALFSDTARATAYAQALADQKGQSRASATNDPATDDLATNDLAMDDLATNDLAMDGPPAKAWQVKQPTPEQTVRILAACVRAGIQVAALNPHAGEAQRLFDLADILRDVRGRLQRGEALRF